MPKLKLGPTCRRTDNVGPRFSSASPVGPSFSSGNENIPTGESHEFDAITVGCPAMPERARVDRRHRRATGADAVRRARRRKRAAREGREVRADAAARRRDAPHPDDARRARRGAWARSSPDGKRLFFTWSITGTPNVWRLDGPKSFPVQLTGGEDPTRLSGITPDGKYLVLSRDVGGQENPGLYLQRADGGPLTEVQHKKGTRAGYGFSTRDDSKTIYFSANDIKPDSYAIYRYDIAAAKRELVFDQPGLWKIADHREGQGGALTCCSRRRPARCRASSPSTTSPRSTLTPLFGQNESGRVRRRLRACRRRAVRPHQQARRVPSPLQVEARRRPRAR